MQQLTTTTPTSKGLTGFQIKIIALVLMLLDHIYYFFEFTGAIPIWFSWLGRLSAGLFLFTVVEGFIHTHNRKAYFWRIWAMGAAMGVIKYILMLFFTRPDGFFPENGIFQTFTVLLILWQGIDWLKQKHWLKGLLALLLPFAALAVLFALPGNIQGWAYLLQVTVCPLPLITEGGLPILVEGLILYTFHKNRKLQVGLWALFVIGWNLYAGIIMQLSFAEYFTVGYEWMGVFAGVLMLLYNGQKGKSMKGLFYAFYPAHVYILYALSFAAYAILNT